MAYPLNGEMAVYPIQQTLRGRIGDPSILAFEYAPGKLEVGAKCQVVRVVAACLRDHPMVDRPFLRATLASFCNDKKAEREANIAAIALLGDSERAQQYFRANVLCRDEIHSRLSQCLQSIKFRLDVSGNEVTVQVTENLDGPEIEAVAVAVAVAGVRDELAKILGVTALRTSLFVRGKRAREEVPLLPGSG